MYPLDKITDKDRKFYESLLERIDPTYSVERLLEEFTSEEIDEMVAKANKLPDPLYSSRRLARRLTRLVTAQSIPKRTRRKSKKQLKGSNN